MISAIIFSIVAAKGMTAQQALEKVESVYKACKSTDVVYTLKEQRRTHRVHVLIVKDAGWAAEVVSSELFPTGYRVYEKKGQTGFIVHPNGGKNKIHEVALAVDMYLVASVASLIKYPIHHASMSYGDLSKAVFGPETSWQGKPAVQVLVEQSRMKISYYLNADYTRILAVKSRIESKGPDGRELATSTSYDNQKLDMATSKDLDAWIARAEKLVKPENTNR